MKPKANLVTCLTYTIVSATQTPNLTNILTELAPLIHSDLTTDTEIVTTRFVAACRPIEESVSPQRLGDTRPRYQRNGCNTDLLKRPTGPVAHIVHRKTGNASSCETRVAPLAWAAER